MNQRTFAIIFLGTLASALLVQGNNISISLFATDLSGCGAFNYCDPYVEIYCQSKLSDWQPCGKTKYLSETNFPVWPEIFVFDHVESNREQWEFRVLDDDYDADDLLASVRLDVGTFVQATDGTSSTYAVDLGGHGKLYIRRNKLE